MAADSMAKATIHEPVGTKNLWKHKGWQLPAYIQHIANDLREKRGMTESRAISTAVAVVKRWAAGGGNVHPDTRAAAAKAVAEWEALKARAAASRSLTASPAATVDLAAPHPGQRFRHGWIPVMPTGEARKRLTKALVANVGAAITAKRKHGDGSPEHKAALAKVEATHRAIRRLKQS